jgi:hypothetical protein
MKRKKTIAWVVLVKKAREPDSRELIAIDACGIPTLYEGHLRKYAYASARCVRMVLRRDQNGKYRVRVARLVEG